jgi:hypothetical protein
MERMFESVLLCGEPTTSKTWSLINLALNYPERQVTIFDFDRGTPKVVQELGGDIPNLTIHIIREWPKLVEKFKEEHARLGKGDWLCIDMLSRMWDLAQAFYSNYVFGEDPIEHLMTMKKQVNKVGFGGFDGLTDWAIIKRLHNEQIIDLAILGGEYNVMATTSIREILPVEKDPKPGSLESIYAREFGFKPEGEKHNIHRFDTQVYLYRKADGAFWFRIIRDRGRPVNIRQEYKIEGDFWSTYRALRGFDE